MPKGRTGFTQGLKKKGFETGVLTLAIGSVRVTYGLRIL